MRDPNTIMSIASIKELGEVKIEKDYISLGSKVTLSKLEEYSLEFYPEFASILKVFGSPQIKNSATLAGNIANASPIADTLPFLFVMNAEIELTGLNGSRKVNINDFYKGYKILDLNKDEMITKIFIPLLKDNEKIKLYKISKRKDLDISTFTAAFKITEEDDVIKDINIAYGGVGPVIIRLKQTEEFLRNKNINHKTMAEAGKIAIDEITPISDVRGSKNFRLQLAENILMKLYFDLQKKGEKVCQ
jgi:xanthine dehydrogenase small subunit